MKIKIALLIYICCSIFSIINAQQTFVKTFGGRGFAGSGDENVTGGIPTNDGGYLIYGFTNTYTIGDYDAFLLKIDSSDNQQWTNFVGATGNNINIHEKPQDAIELPNGDFVIVGQTTTNNGSYDAYAFNTNSQGSVGWRRNFENTGSDKFSSIILTSDNHLLIGGVLENIGGMSQNRLFLVKLELNGNLVWSKTYEGNNINQWALNSISENAEGNYVMVSGVFGSGGQHGVLVEVLPTDGNVLLSKQYSSSLFIIGIQELFSINGDQYIIGTISQNGAYHLWLSQIDNNYDIQWSKIYNSSGDNLVINGVTADNNDFLFSGWQTHNGQSGVLLKMSSTGSVSWAKSYGGSGTDRLQNTLKTSSGFIGVGFSNSYNTNGDYDIFLVKTDQQGNVNGCENDLTINIMNATFSANNLNLNAVNVSNMQGSGESFSFYPFNDSIICPLILPTANFQIDDVCEGDCIDIMDNSTNANTWQWTISGASNGTFTNQNISNFCFDSVGTTTVQLIVSNENGSDTAVQIIELNTVSNFDLGNDTLLCSGDSITLNMTIPNVNYLWSDNSTNSNLTITTGGFYWLEVNLGSCTIRDSIFINEILFPDIDLGNDTIAICQNDFAILDAFHATATSYLWQDNSTESQFTTTESGVYYVAVSNGCETAFDTVEIIVSEPTLVVNLGLNQNLCENETITLDATTANGIWYLWEDSTTSPIRTITTIGEYEVIVKNGCLEVSDDIVIRNEDCCQPYIPNVITPNNDGINDEFQIYLPSKNCSLINNFSMEIFDRWGGKVFQTNNLDTKWNGTSNGKNISDGVYIYIIQYNDGVKNYQISGDLTVIR